MAHLAQQENAIAQFAALSTTVRSCGGNLFQTRTYENDYGAWEFLRVLEEVMQKRFHDRLEAAEVMGLECDESTDTSDSSNALMFLHTEVNYCCPADSI